MKKIFLLLISLFSFSFLIAQVHVRGYYKKNGTYVEPYLRTYPDGIIYNNYSYPGNYNPNKDNHYYYPQSNSSYNQNGTNNSSTESSNNYIKITTGSFVSILFDAKLKSSRDVFSNVIAIIPKNSLVKIESSVERGIYYVSFNGLKGYMNDLYFEDINNKRRIQVINATFSF